MRRFLNYFSKNELFLWAGSVIFILSSYFIFDRSSLLKLTASLVGVTSLIFAAKGNPAGPFLMIVFSVLYGIISYSFYYYGEMITYLGMTMPMSVFALISWLRNSYNGNRSQVAVNRISKVELLFMALLTAGVTVLFYFILDYLNTANLFFSTLSVATSFSAVYLTFRRSPYYALCYSANDGILIILWGLACMEEISYLSVVICFVVFLINDIYGFLNWRKMEQLQKKTV